MNTEPLVIDGVAGPVVVSTHPLWGSLSGVTVGGMPVARAGKRQYTFPALPGGTVPATVRTGFGDPYPTVEINGVRHRTGPQVPVILKILILLPIALVAFGGALGGAIGVVGAMANQAAARTQLPPVVRALMMIGITGVALVIWLAIALAITGAVSHH